MSDESWRLQKQLEAARVLRESYAEALGDDAEAIADTIEGETSLFEKMEALLKSAREDRAMIEALDKMAEEIDARKDRFKKRYELKRSMIHSALQVAEVQSREFAIATVSRTKAKLKVHVTDEAFLPAKYFEPQPPKLDKRALDADALARDKALAEAGKIEDADARRSAIEAVARENPPIPGIEISQGSENLTIRWA